MIEVKITNGFIPTVPSRCHGIISGQQCELLAFHSGMHSVTVNAPRCSAIFGGNPCEKLSGHAGDCSCSTTCSVVFPYEATDGTTTHSVMTTCRRCDRAPVGVSGWRYEVNGPDGHTWLCPDCIVVVEAAREKNQRCNAKINGQQCEKELLHMSACVFGVPPWTCTECLDEGCSVCDDEFDAIPRIHARAAQAKTFDELVALARELPEPMTEEQRIEQAINWGWSCVTGPEYENPKTKAIFASAVWKRECLKVAAGLESFRDENAKQRATIVELRKTVAEYRDLHFREQNEIGALKKDRDRVITASIQAGPLVNCTACGMTCYPRPSGLCGMCS